MTAAVLEQPVVRPAEVIARARQGDYYSLTFVAPEVAERARPGQFVSLQLEPDSRCILRRPFSVARAVAAGPKGGQVEVVFDAIGRGTSWLAARKPGDRISVVGPLGKPYRLPDRPIQAMLVGGGYGSAPLFFLAEVLRGSGSRVDMIIGAATESRILGALEARRVSQTATFTTEDGSTGMQGRVTDAMPVVAAESAPEVIYACGPMPMLRAVAEVAAGMNVHCEIAVEEFMACGIGVCWTCVVPVRTKSGAVAMKRACTEGPVFTGSEVEWP